MAALDNIASELLKSANEADLIYKRTRDQAQRDKAVRLRRIVENLKAISAGGLTPTLDEVLTEGNVSTNTLNVGGITSDYFQLDTAATPTLAPGMFGWDDAYGTADLRLKGNNVTLQVGQEILARVVNKTGADLLESDYKVVRVRIASEGGAQGQRLAVVLAQGNNDPDSVTTLGIVTENIANNEEGFITILGNVNNIDTTGTLQGETWVDGDVLYLSPTTPGGLTKVPPVSPNHTVTIGYVVYAHQNQGKIFVKVDNGYELDELHNVLITSPANNDLLQYNSAQQVWKNVASSVAVPTPTLAQVTTAGNTTTNAITVGGLTVATNLIYTDTVNGRVGIGTTGLVPGILLTINGSVSISAGQSLKLDPSANIYMVAASSQFRLYTGAIAALSIANTGNVLIGTTTDAGYKLDVNGTARLSGTLTVGQVIKADGTSNLIMQAHVAAASVLTVKYSSVQNATTTEKSLITLDTDYSPTAGASLFTALRIVPTINQTGTASGISRGVYINPTITSAVDFRAIETTAGNVVFNGGNVGIGTSNPLYKLHVTDSAGDIVYILASTGQSAIIGATGSGTNRMYIGYSPGAENISITSSGVVRLNSITSGNVLIGTTTDSGYKLDVNGTVRINSYLTVLDSPYVNTGRIYFGSGSAYGPSGTNPLYMRHDSGNWYFTGLNGEELTISLNPGSTSTFTLAQGDVYFNANQASKNLYLQTQAATKMAILSSGNVGIGTINPTDKFHIVDNTNGNKFGRISAGGTDASAAWVAQNDQVDNVVYRVFGSAVTGSQMGQALARSASLIANLGGTGKFLIGSFSGTDLIFGTSDQARMRLVDATGNFLIGTMTDNGNKLTVSGDIDAQGYKVNNVLGYTGILNIPTNPPGQQNIDIQGGIVINIF